MNLSDYIAREHKDEIGILDCWRLEVTPPPARLVVHTWRVDEGEKKHPGTYSVLIGDLNPGSVRINKAFEEGELNKLEVDCAFYRDAVVTREDDEPDDDVYRSPVFQFPLAKGITDLPSAVEFFRQFLVGHGAKPVASHAEAVADLLEPVEAALKPAQRFRFLTSGRRTTLEQTLSLDAGKILLTQRTEIVAGEKRIPLWRLPLGIWKYRKVLTPMVRTATFELLSLDPDSDDSGCVKKMPDGPEWMASLYSVKHLDTCVHEDSAQLGSYTLWYLDVFFPDEASANLFVKVCAEAVKQLRERLYRLHTR
jgi:hypothetical protein